MEATRDIAKESRERAAEELKMADGDSVTVASDGIWQRRGFSSKNGLATCLSFSSKGPSKVIDAEVLTNYCDTCKKNGSPQRGG